MAPAREIEEIKVCEVSKEISKWKRFNRNVIVKKNSEDLYD